MLGDCSTNFETFGSQNVQKSGPFCPFVRDLEEIQKSRHNLPSLVVYRDSSSQDFEFHMYNDFELECSWCCAIYYYSLTQTSILCNGKCASGNRALNFMGNFLEIS